MELIKVIDIIGTKSAISPPRALRLYDYIIQKIKSDDKLNISFEDVQDLTSAFCNASIGKLYMNIDIKILDTQLLITGIEESHIWFKKIRDAILLGTNENARILHKSNLEEVILS